MTQQPHEIFFRAHRVYIRGMRAGISECLKAVYGPNWWAIGVLPALSKNQLDNIKREMKNVAREDYAQLLDSVHFRRIVKRNQAAAFASKFTDIDRVLRLLSLLSKRRNQWAHVQDDQWTVDTALALAKTMRMILTSLRRREALELRQMFEDGLESQPSIPEEELDAPEDELSDITDDYDAPVAEGALMSFWQTLESYLEVESVVEPGIEGETDEGFVRVLVRVTNTAPSSEGRPDITFRQVRLDLTGTRALMDSQYSEWHDVRPGQTKTSKFSVAAKGLASVELHVSGQVDQDRLLQVRHRGILPDEHVSPLLEQFSIQFEEIGIDAAIAEIVRAATKIQPDMPFAEVSALRKKLRLFKQLVTEKRDALWRLFEEYYIDRDSRLGAPFNELLKQLNQLERKKIDEMDVAISNTDMDSIRNVAADFEQLQISILRGRDTIRERLSVRGQ